MLNHDLRTLRDLAIEVPGAISIFEELGLDYCCGGKKSLKQACVSLGLELETVLEKLDQAQVSRTGGKDFRDYKTLPLHRLINEIIQSHHEFTRKELTLLDNLLSKVSAAHGRSHAELLRLRPILDELSEELKTHMIKEEKLLFPYILQLEDADTGKAALLEGVPGTVRDPIQKMLDEHDETSELLRRIRQETFEFSLPGNACTSYRALYQEFQELERDLHQHIHLENNILFPRAIELETRLLNPEN